MYMYGGVEDSSFEYSSSLERTICTDVHVAGDMKHESPSLNCPTLVECQLLTCPITNAYSRSPFINEHLFFLVMFTNAKNVKYLKCCDFFLLLQTLIHQNSVGKRKVSIVITGCEFFCISNFVFINSMFRTFFRKMNRLNFDQGNKQFLRGNTDNNHRLHSVEHLRRVYPFSKKVKHLLNDRRVTGDGEEGAFSSTRENKVSTSFDFLFMVFGV